MGIQNELVNLEKNIIPPKEKGVGNRDVIEVAGKCYGLELRLVLVYFDVDKSRTGEGYCRNRRIQKIVESRIEKEGTEGLIVMGDFNAHLIMLGAKDNDINGRMVLEWLDKYDLVLMNADRKCKGLFTWGRREQRSSIDLVLVNRKMYELCSNMSIDEEGDVINFSDHNLITLELKLRGGDLVKYSKGKWETGTFLKKDPDSIRKLTQELDRVWVKGMGYEDMWKNLMVAQDKILKSNFRKRIGDSKEGEVEEAEWVTQEIRDGIAERRRLKRKQRNSKGIDSIKWEREWWIQKIKVQRLVSQAKGNWESNEAWSIRNCGDKGKRLWQRINKLRGKNKEDEEVWIYVEGEKQNLDDSWDELIKFWTSIYQMRPGNVMGIWEGGWSEGLHKRYERELGERELRIALGIANREDMIEPMELPIIRAEDMLARIRKLKAGKAAGRDLVKGEVLKVIAENEQLLKVWEGGLNGVFTDEIIPSSWVTSNTKLIKKNKKPSFKEFRPIAITSVGYKLFFGIIKDSIEEHLINNNLIWENQIGFTTGGRLEFNLFILQYLVDATYKSKAKSCQKLIIVALDFKKAYDSIDRGKLIETLVKYKIHPHIINLIAKVYSGDETVVGLGGKEGRIKVTSGIRQGCTASTVLFKLITYIIIDNLHKEGSGGNRY